MSANLSPSVRQARQARVRQFRQAKSASSPPAAVEDLATLFTPLILLLNTTTPAPRTASPHQEGAGKAAFGRGALRSARYTPCRGTPPPWQKPFAQRRAGTERQPAADDFTVWRWPDPLVAKKTLAKSSKSREEGEGFCYDKECTKLSITTRSVTVGGWPPPAKCMYVTYPQIRGTPSPTKISQPLILPQTAITQITVYGKRAMRLPRFELVGGPRPAGCMYVVG